MIDTERFIEKCKLNYNDAYTYENTMFYGYHELVEITCVKHGSFKCYAKHMLYGMKTPCPICRQENNNMGK